MTLQRAVRLFFVLVGLCILLALLAFAARQQSFIAAKLLIEQDLAGLLFTAFLVLLFRKLADNGTGPEPRLPPLALALAALVLTGAAFVGGRMVLHNFGLTADEWWAATEGAHYWRGLPYGPMPDAWRGYAGAMTPSFVVTSADGSVWGSMYLPVNGALQFIGPPGLASALLMGWSFPMLWLAGRQLLPDRPVFAVVALALTLVSAQVLVTAMTPYAMTAHLALNLTWLVLVLRDRVWSHLLAVPVGFAATGLHQFAFFPMFALPFVALFLMQRRHRLAAFHGTALALTGAFWASWLKIGMGFLGQTLPPATKAGWSVGPWDVAVLLWKRVDFWAVPEMAENILRFISWNHPLLTILFAVGAVPAWRRGGAFRALLGGVALTFVVVALISPYQGHGWGYRYLHGLIGSMALVAALGLLTVVDQTVGAGRRSLWGAFLTVTLLTAALMLPLRVAQARAMVAPYLAADRAIAATDADFVVIAYGEHAFIGDLVRNDPGLRQRPLRFDMRVLTQGQLSDLCRRGSVARFDMVSARAFGLYYGPVGRINRVWPAGCGTRRVLP